MSIPSATVTPYAHDTLPAPTWSAFHVYAHGTRTTTDSLLLRAANLAREVVARGQASSWFVMRYWEGGPHIRLRLRDLDPALVDPLSRQLHDLAMDSPELIELDPETFYGPLDGAGARQRHGWFPTGVVLTPPYEPEVERYAGADQMDHAERMFALSSQLAARATALVLDGQDRLGLGLGLICQHVSGLLQAGLTPDVVATGMRRYAQNFANLPGAPRTDVAAQIDRAERHYEVVGSRLQEMIRAEDPAADREQPAPGSQPWAGAVASYAQDLMGPGIDLAAAGRLEPEELRRLGIRVGRAWGAVGSQWHMLANRMGISIADEVYLAWLVSMAVLRAPSAATMHDPALPQWRAYAEASKFRRGGMSVMGPRKAAARQVPSMRVVEDRVELPAPDAALVGSMAHALVARRSSYGTFTGPLTPQQVGTFLGLAAGLRDSYRAEEAGRGVEVHQTTYPRAGGVGTIRLDVSMGDQCLGIPAGHYEYDPVEHRLLRLGPDNRAALATCCPYSQPDAQGRAAIDIVHAAMVVTVLLDSRALAPRYGQRALRFGLLEAGHVSQNLLLVGASLGWKSIPLGGFYDDELATASDADGVGVQPVYVLPFGRPESRSDAEVE